MGDMIRVLSARIKKYKKQQEFYGCFLFAEAAFSDIAVYCNSEGTYGY